MADATSAHPQNVNGRFFVDVNCIDCDLCREKAPENFTRDEVGGLSYVVKQPENNEEEANCRQALENCPVEAIGTR